MNLEDIYAPKEKKRFNVHSLFELRFVTVSYVMTKETKIISLEEAVNEVEVAMRRVALLHLAFSDVLVEELGEKRGKELVIKAILEYGRKITHLVQQGVQDLPRFGIAEEVSVDDQGQLRAKGCVLAKTFKQFDALELGCLYCYVDAAKSMATDPTQKLIHLTCEACGDDYCTFVTKPTTEEERQAFQNKSAAWKSVDPRLEE